LQNDKGQPLSLSITYTTAEHAQRLTLLREEAKKAGLNLELNLMDASAGFKSMLEKNTRAPGWPGAAAAIPPTGSTSTRSTPTSPRPTTS
jgi:microcin C transport system substrate-binding protein